MWSRRAGESVQSPVALTDVFPTIAEVAGVPAPSGLAGRSLTLALAEAGSKGASEPRRVYSETLYPRLHLGWSDLASLTDDRHQYIESPKAELYDVVADRARKNDLASQYRPRSARCPRARPDPAAAPAARRVGSESVKKLAALGYISATNAGADLSRKDLPSPRGPSERSRSSRRASAPPGGALRGEAGGRLPRAAQTDPGMVDVRQLYADACLKLGRDEGRPGKAPVRREDLAGESQVLMAPRTTTSRRALRRGAQARGAGGEAGPSNPHGEPGEDAPLAEGHLEEAEREARAASRALSLAPRSAPHPGRVARTAGTTRGRADASSRLRCRRRSAA
jgi:hypothetical protein